MGPIQQTWMVTLLRSTGEGLTPIIEGTILTFSIEGDRLNGSAGCNRYVGPIATGDEVSAGPLATTMMNCSEPAGVMEQERLFLDLLAQTDSIHIADDRLEMSHSGQVVIVMSPMRTGLVGSWALRSHHDGQSAMVSLIVDTEITAIFEDGRLRGHSGCNRYSTTYETSGTSLSISPPLGTRMMCQEPPGLMKQETRYLELLPTTASHLIRDGQILDLTDQTGKRILQYSRV